MALPPLLAELGIPAACIDQRTHADEKGRSFVIRPQRDEVVWRIIVDRCWLKDFDGLRTDYLFWCSNNQERFVLVELKGQDFGHALEQIASTLAYLYQRKPELRQVAAQGGICAYVVLSKGQAVAQRLNEKARIQKRYGVIVRQKSQRFEINGIDGLC